VGVFIKQNKEVKMCWRSPLKTQRGGFADGGKLRGGPKGGGGRDRGFFQGGGDMRT